MITGFEEITAKLTSEELQMIPVLVEGLNGSSKKQPFNNLQMRTRLAVLCKKVVDNARIRKMINYISINKLTRQPLVANSKGYYITGDEFEIFRYCSSLKDRANAIEYRRQVLMGWEIAR